MKNSKFLTLSALLAFSPMAFAVNMPAGPESSINVELTDISQQGNNLVVNLDVNAAGVDMPSKLKTVYLPMIVNGNDTACFDSFSVTGKKRWNNDLAGGNTSAISIKGWGKDKGALLTTATSGQGYSVSGNPSNYSIQLSIPYQDWMAVATFMIDCCNFTCPFCLYPNQLVEEQMFALAETCFLPEVYEAEIVYSEPVKTNAKYLSMQEKAYLDFKVNQTTILKNYRNNAAELAAMKANIDSINNDEDYTVRGITIHGMASPEGPYANNVRLAKGRTDALRDYLIKDYKVSKDFITSTYEPAINWEGLRAWLNNNQIENGAAILAIVNSDLPDFDRNTKIKTDYPTQYKWLLENVYPSLRVSEYFVDYDVREFTEAAEILEVMGTNPEKLSVSEIYEAAVTQGEDSEVFAQAMQIAVNQYPDDPTANLNAGYVAMKKGDFTAAEKYFAKAGDSDEAKLARAQLAASKGENDKALKLFKELEKSSNAAVAKEASAAAANIEKIIKAAGSKFNRL